MLVVCGRCETEYEFDDALLSERGTTVKCTNCGYQFRVRPPRGLLAAGERWTVDKANGEREEFPSLRELRRAIETGSVGMDDRLSREGGAPRRVRDVPELEALFRRQRGREQHAQTLVGVGVPEQVKNAPIPARAVVSAAGSTEVRARISSMPPTPRMSPPQTSLIDMGPARRSPPPRKATSTPPGTPVAYESFSSEDRKSASFATVPPRAPGELGGADAVAGAGKPDLSSTWTSPQNSASAELHPEPAVHPTVTKVSGQPPALVAPGPTAEPDPLAMTQPSAADAPSGAGRRGSRRADRGIPASSVQFASVPPLAPSKTPPPPAMGVQAPPTPRSVAPPPRRPSSIRWIVGFVLLGGAALLVGTVGREYLAQFVGGDEAATDAAVQGTVDSAWESFRDGQLEAARTQFEHARSTAPDDPNALLGLIQLDVVQADFEWLRVRLLSDSEEGKRQAAREQLQRHIERAQAAFASVPRVPNTAKRTALIETDALRVKGEYTAARALVERSKFDPTDPHAAYVLSVLDLGEGTPAWSTVIERLQNALVSERALGRARAALIYALAASGDVERARAELEKLGDHPLIEELRAFVAASAQPDAEGEAAAPEPTGPAIDLDSEVAEPAAGRAPVWRYLDEASAARRSGDLAGAQRSYEKALAASPGNANALAGLGAIARLNGKYQDAKNYFDQVLERSPEHLASLVGGADVRWLMGAREGAVLLYRKIPPGSAFHSHAQRRIAEHEGRRQADDDSQGGAPEAPEAKADVEEAAPKREPDSAEPDAPSAPGTAGGLPPRAGDPAEPAPQRPDSPAEESP